VISFLRVSRSAVLALTVAALIALAGIVAKRDELRLAARPTPPPPPLPVVADTRLLIFAPHPDDEVIAAGGLIQQAREAGGTVRVVYITSGDSYPASVRADQHVSRPRGAD